MKKCCKCQERKPLSFYNKNKARKDGYNTICRVCSNERSRKYYDDNREHHKLVITNRRRRLKVGYRKKLMDLLKSSLCADCRSSDHRTFEFDHVRGEKKNNIAQLMADSYRWEVVMDEIKKCEVVCANCHRIRTFRRSGCYRLS